VKRCKHGHPWTESNSKWYRHSRTGNRYRVCKRCAADRERARYQPVPRKLKPERPCYYPATEYPL
jgi:hypothetical protein